MKRPLLRLSIQESPDIDVDYDYATMSPDIDVDYDYDYAMEGRKPFDKFMDRILTEGAQRRPQVSTAGDSLQRKRAARVQDRPLNRIRMRGSR